jgi:hypothetical protein
MISPVVCADRRKLPAAAAGGESGERQEVVRERQRAAKQGAESRN